MKAPTVKIKELFEEHIDKIKFGSIGAFNTFLDFVLLNIFTGLLGFPVVAGNTISTGITTTVSFLVNRKWVFGSKTKKIFREIAMFFGVTLTTAWVINNGIVQVGMYLLPDSWNDVLRLNLAKVLATGVSMVCNYFAYKYIVFSGDEISVGKIRDVLVGARRYFLRNFWIVLLICSVFGFLVNLAMGYPGRFSPDSIRQLTQAETGEYNSWHPVAMAMTWRWLMGLFGGNFAALLVLFMIILWSSIFILLYRGGLELEARG